MTANDIEALLVRDRWQANTTVPNYTPANWWECDVISFTEAGYWREYEIKISRADFFHDASKSENAKSPHWNALKTVERVKKHELLKAGSPRGPVQFWFVVPAGLIRMNEVPAFAGLIEITDGPRLSEKEVVKAPRLHSVKADEKIRLHAVGVCYWRWHGVLAKFARLQRETKQQIGTLRKFGWPKARPKIAD